MTDEDKSFLLALREYIEREEVSNDAEFGAGRTLEQIVADGDMPTVYGEVLRRLSA